MSIQCFGSHQLLVLVWCGSHVLFKCITTKLKKNRHVFGVFVHIDLFLLSPNDIIVGNNMP